jgi:hypothetical protein
MAQSKAVAKTKDAGLPAFLKGNQYADFVDEGLEQADADSFAVPFLRILQSNSPQVKKTDGRYVEGASEGMLINTVTQEIFDPTAVELKIVPVYYRRAFMEWKADERGGYVAEHSVPDGLELLKECERDDKNRDILPNGNQLSDTRYHYVIIVRPDGTYEPAIITMERTQTKKSKRLNSDIDIKKKSKGVPYMQAFLYNIGVEGESKGENSWWGWDLSFSGLVEDQDLFDTAVDFHNRIRAGEIKEATDSLSDPVSETEEGTEY